MRVLWVQYVAVDMVLKRTQPATGYEEIDRWDGGVGWFAHPDEEMLRASHALATAPADGPASDRTESDDGADVWVVDPVDAPGIDDLFAELGDVVGVVVLLSRHFRDADAIAGRHDVPVFVPAWFDKIPELDAPLRRFDDHLPGTDYRVLEVLDRFGWEEAALYDEKTRTLVIPEAVGSAPYYTTPSERLGVHPMLRLTPPSALRGLRPERVVVGHGRGVMDDATRALMDALDGARRRTPKLYAENIRNLVQR